MDYDRYKLFVGGIPKETSEETLKQHFSRYGVVLGAIVAKDKVTGQPRGFGFVRFANECDVAKALKDNHVILGRAVDVKLAIRKSEQLMYQPPANVERINKAMHEMSGNGYNRRTKKIFVGGLSSNTTEDEFKSYFEKFGKTTDVVVMHDGMTNRPRGFGFVTFDSEDSVEIVMQSSFHELSDKRVEVKRAIPKEGLQSSNGVGAGNRNVPPNFSSFQARPFVPEQNGYGMVVPYPPPVIGYPQTVQGFHYPVGYQYTAPMPNVPWNNPMMPPTGFYCAPPLPPPTNAPCYLPYVNGFGLSGMSVPGYNPVAWPVASGGSGSGSGTGVLIPQFESLKLEVPREAHNRMNGGGNMGKPLQNGTYI